jgi:hypothetical protein
VGVLLDPLQRLAGLPGEDPVEPVAHLQNLPRLDLDVAGGAPAPPEGWCRRKRVLGRQ